MKSKKRKENPLKAQLLGFAERLEEQARISTKITQEIEASIKRNENNPLTSFVECGKVTAE